MRLISNDGFQSQTGPEAWVLPHVLSDTEFRDRWKSALSQNPQARAEICRFDDYWQYKKTSLEVVLRAPLLLLQGPAIGVDFAEKVHPVIRWYVTHLNEIRDVNKAFRKAIKAVSDAHGILNGSLKGTRLVASETDSAASLREIKTTLEERYRTHWTRELVDFDLSGTRLGRMPTQERNLDSMFQCLVGVIFKKFGPHLEFTTISSLVLLTYISSQLAAENKDGELVVLESEPERVLTIEAIYEKLRKDRLPELK